MVLDQYNTICRPNIVTHTYIKFIFNNILNNKKLFFATNQSNINSLYKLYNKNTLKSLL